MHSFHQLSTKHANICQHRHRLASNQVHWKCTTYILQPFPKCQNHLKYIRPKCTIQNVSLWDLKYMAYFYPCTIIIKQDTIPFAHLTRFSIDAFNFKTNLSTFFLFRFWRVSQSVFRLTYVFTSTGTYSITVQPSNSLAQVTLMNIHHFINIFINSLVFISLFT